jgi:hypothetical protein
MAGITETILRAHKLTYRASEDELYADGIHVGGADTLTRDLMLQLTDKSWHDSDDEALFSAIVEIE